MITKKTVSNQLFQITFKYGIYLNHTKMQNRIKTAKAAMNTEATTRVIFRE